MAHPWDERRPLSAWYPGGYSEKKGGKVSRTIYPVINQEKCIHCNMCWIFCPEGCIDRSSGNMVVNLTYCRGCGVCAKECNKEAIEMVRES